MRVGKKGYMIVKIMLHRCEKNFISYPFSGFARKPEVCPGKRIDKEEVIRVCVSELQSQSGC